MKPHICNILYIISFDAVIVSIFALKFNKFLNIPTSWGLIGKTVCSIILFGGIFGIYYLTSKVDFSKFKKAESIIWRLCFWICTILSIMSLSLPFAHKCDIKIIFESFFGIFFLYQIYLLAKKKI